MEVDDDPFPHSLPYLEEPKILSADMTEAAETNSSHLDSTSYGSPNFFSNTYQSPHKINSNYAFPNPAGLRLSSTESFSESSSSESFNNQHERKHSSESSRSDAFNGDGHMQIDDSTQARSGMCINGSSIDGRQSYKQPWITDVDNSNRAMEMDFDFESAASSPYPHPETRASLSSSLAMSSMVPSQSHHNSDFGDQSTSFPTRLKVGFPTVLDKVESFANQCGSQSVRPTYDYPPTVTGHEDAPRMVENQQQQHFDLSRTYGSNAILAGSPPDIRCHNNFVGSSASLHHTSEKATHQQPIVKPSPPELPNLGPAERPTLYVHNLPPKSRVETQIPVKMTLYPVPPGVSKLHIQSYTVAKPKLVAQPKHTKSSDMLELHAMLVRSSAMEDPRKLERAFAFAAGPRLKIPKEDLRTSSGDSVLLDEDLRRPVNGGPVEICGGCIERERKRNSRKKTRNTDEELLWLKDEAKRSIMFNIPEVLPLKQPSLPKDKKGNMIRGLIGCSEALFPENAKEVDFPMRIACYCRHHEEKSGFRVIFTLLDSHDQVVTQTITNSIIITDDHKTHPVPGVSHSHGGTFQDGVGVFSSGGGWQGITPNQGAAPLTKAYSVTDLNKMQHHYNAQEIDYLVTQQNRSQITSATMTPNPSSRQASLSAPSGQHSKKRKANGPGRIPNDLAMTQLYKPNPLSFQHQVPPSSSLHFNGDGSCEIPSPSQYPYFHDAKGMPLSSMPSQHSTNPPTPSASDIAFLSCAQHSQSAENLQQPQAMHSSPASMLPSRVPSPTLGPQTSSMWHGHAHMLANSLRSVPGVTQTRRTPIIHKLTPAEGPKSGGIEITCLGTGFRQGLEVMFGDVPAITTTCWNEGAVVCLLPPSENVCTVLVTFKDNFEESMASTPKKMVTFKYFDNDEQELMKHALTLINWKWNGTAVDPGDSARNIISFLGANPSLLGGSGSGGSGQSSNQHRHLRNLNSAIPAMIDLETAVLSCLNLVDLDDSLFQINLDAQGSNGQSMLHLGAALGFYRLTAGLLARGANPDIRDNNGMSPMHLASLRDHPQIIRKLRSAGADPTIRSLNGLTAADMARSQHVLDVSNASEHHVRSRSAVAPSATRLSRASSVKSLNSSHGLYAKRLSNPPQIGFEKSNSESEAFIGPYKSQSRTPPSRYATSRRSSAVTESNYLSSEAEDKIPSSPSMFAANPGISALRDQLLAQIQQLQQSVHRTLPALQIPTFPPIPNLPDYQTYPVVRRISSLVPQRTSRPGTADSSSKPAKEVDYHWWELLTGPAPSPPAYEEIYPDTASQGLDSKKASALRAAGEALMDQRCEAEFERTERSPTSSIIERVDLGSCSLTQKQREQLRAAHAIKVKKLKSDRNLFFIWIPLLVFVLFAMLKDWVPKVLYGGHCMFQYARERYQGRLAEVV